MKWSRLVLYVQAIATLVIGLSMVLVVIIPSSYSRVMGFDQKYRLSSYILTMTALIEIVIISRLLE
jgi:hypothetical protein